MGIGEVDAAVRVVEGRVLAVRDRPVEKVLPLVAVESDASCCVKISCKKRRLLFYEAANEAIRFD